MTWTAAETNTHQDHVIAHVIGATPLGISSGTKPLISCSTSDSSGTSISTWRWACSSPVAIPELEADDEKKRELSEVRNVESSPIESVELFEYGDERRLVLNCELDRLVVETSLATAWIKRIILIRIHLWLK